MPISISNQASEFHDSVLYISLRSPFARRVRLAFLEAGVRFDEVLNDVFKPTPELIKANPLARVPALRLKSGEVIVDSHAILAAFQDSHPGAGLLPPDASTRRACHAWSGLAVGYMERIVEWFLESIRPVEKQDSEILSEMELFTNRFLQRLEAEVPDEGFILGAISQADLDIGAALGYMTLRYLKDWKKRFPRTFKYWENLSNRDSFRRTEPPKA